MPRRDALRKLEAVKSMIGQVTDAEVAEAAEVSLGSVRAYRRRHGIAPAGKRRKTFHSLADEAPAQSVVDPIGSAAHRRTRGKDVRPRRSKVGAFRSLLGILSDSEIATRAGVSVEAVRVYRKRHQIQSPAVGHGVAELPRRRRSALDPYWDRLGQEPDSDIAVLAGVTAENVRAFRQRHGIEAAWKGARSRNPLANSDDERPSVGSRDSNWVPSSAPMQGFLVSIQGRPDCVVTAPDISTALSVAMLRSSGPVTGIQFLGPILND